VIGIDIDKNSFHVVGHAIMLRQKWSRGQVQTRLAKLPPSLRLSRRPMVALA
jgi:transposase